MNARRRMSQSDSFTGSPSLLTPEASPMLGRRLQSVSDPQPILRLVIQGLVKKVCRIILLWPINSLGFEWQNK